MTLCLFVHNLGQQDIREALAKRKEKIPNQVGKDIQNPSMKWVFQTMQKIVKIKVDLSFKVFEEFKCIGETQRKIIQCFGIYAMAIYGFP